MIETLHAQDLPAEWDALVGDNYALRRSFLQDLEISQPCDQRYYMFHTSEGRLDSLLMTFRIRMNLMQYTPFSWHEKVTMIHVPISVTRPALVIGEQTRAEVEAFIAKIKGYTIVLNWRGTGTLAHLTSGNMSPQLSLALHWKTFAEYLASMRSNYRHRYLKAQKKGQQLTFRFLENNTDFTAEFYQFYAHVNKKSRIRIETLCLEYFRQSTGRILLCELAGKPMGFMQLIENGSELVWAFVGYEPAHNHECDTYLNMLLFIVRYAIENGFTVLEMGQTAEDAKLKLGARYTPLRILVGHSNPIMNFSMHLSMPFLGYTPPPEHFHVFHGEAP